MLIIFSFLWYNIVFFFFFFGAIYDFQGKLENTNEKWSRNIMTDYFVFYSYVHQVLTTSEFY